MQFDRRSPLYEQLVEHYKENIANGQYPPGSVVPSRRELASKQKINPNTAQRAYKGMEELGMITTIGNSPSRITQDASKIATIRTELVQHSLEEFIARARRLKISKQEVATLVSDYFKEEQRHD